MKSKSRQGFSFIEILIYLFISSLLLALLSTMIWNTLRANRTYKAEEAIIQNAQFIMNFSAQQIRPVYSIADIRPDPATARFYTSSSTAQWFTIVKDNNNLMQTFSSSSPSTQLNSASVAVTEFILTPIFDDLASSTVEGVRLRLRLSSTNASESVPLLEKTFETYVGISSR
mgnify:CR=1 FL=1